MTFMHDAWLRAKVQEALADKQPALPHQQVMDEAQAIIDKKRLSRVRVPIVPAFSNKTFNICASGDLVNNSWIALK